MKWVIWLQVPQLCLHGDVALKPFAFLGLITIIASICFVDAA